MPAFPAPFRKLSVIDGGLSRQFTLHGATIGFSLLSDVPPTDALVIESERGLATMELDGSLVNHGLHLVDAPLATPGSLIQHGIEPATFSAIIYDMEQHPVIESEWIRAALQALFQEMQQAQLQSVAMPLLGIRFGHIGFSFFCQELRDVLASGIAKGISITLLTEREHLNALIKRLTS